MDVRSLLPTDADVVAAVEHGEGASRRRSGRFPALCRGELESRGTEFACHGTLEELTKTT